MRIVISGYYGFHNVGDEAILYSIIQALRQQEPNVEIVVLSNHPEETAKAYHVLSVNRWKLNEVLKALKNADGLVSGGGSLLQDQTGLRSIPYYAGIIKIAQILKKPVFIYAQGMGPIHRTYNKQIVKHVLEKVSCLTVRDGDSKQLLEDIGIKKTIDLVPDPVIGLDTLSYQSDWLKEQHFTNPLLTVSVRHWDSNVDYKRKIALALDRCVANQIDVLFVPMHGIHDQKCSQEVRSMMKEKSFLAPYQASIKEKIAIIGKSDLLFGMRLHALIFAATTLTPFVSLSYDPKIDSFTSLCDQTLVGHVRENTWDESTIFTNIKQSLKNANKERVKLKEMIEPLRKAAKQTAKKALTCFS